MKNFVDKHKILWYNIAVTAQEGFVFEARIYPTPEFGESWVIGGITNYVRNYRNRRQAVQGC